MKTTAKPFETVNTLLYRVFGSDSDELENEFYRLNPTQTTLFLEPGQLVELPIIGNEPEPATTNEIPVWM